MDYYYKNNHPIDPETLSKRDLNVFNPKAMMLNRIGNRDYATKSYVYYGFVNNDEHDRILMDPAYRFARYHDALRVVNAVK